MHARERTPPKARPLPLSPKRLHTLEQLIEDGTEEIVRRWLVAVRNDRRVPSTHRLSDSMLQDSVPGVLREILKTLIHGVSTPHAVPIYKAKAHGEVRAGQDYSIDELVREYQVLRRELFLFLEDRLPEFEGITTAQVVILCRQVGAALDDSLRVTTQAYLESYTRELRELARSDSLTGLLNHRMFYERLDTEIHRAERHGLELTVAILDLDHFKQVNEGQGHLRGDQVLRRTGLHLEEELRASDVVCRYGGDEFGVLFPETGRDEARALMPRVREVIEKLGRDLELKVPLSFSFGMAAYPEDGVTGKELVGVADGRLRRIKKNRGDRDEPCESDD